MAGKRRRASWRKRFIYIVTLLLTGGGAGIGSWQLSDHPLLQRLVLGIRDGAVQGKDPKEAIRDGLANLLDGGDSDRDGGIFEVKVADVCLDEGLFTIGQTLDIQVRVVKYDARDQSKVVWDSQTFGQRLAVVGRDALTATWADRPFRVAWSPGERMTVEVWDRHGYWHKRWLEMESPETDARFPLHSGPHRLQVLAGRGKPGAADTSKIVLQSQRVGELSEPVRPSDGNGGSVAEKPIVIR
jgi:hypothetical protein